MHRRTFLLGAAGLTAGCFLPTRVTLAQTWPPEVLRYVRDYQEREYLRLADALNLKTAREAYEKVTNRQMPPDLEQRYRSSPLPTPYEDPFMYPVMSSVFNLMSRENDALGAAALPRPFLATLASGDVEARMTQEPTTRTTIVFFEHGLFSYFYDVAKLMAWAAPPLTEAQLTDDAALARIPRKYTMPFTASQNFVASLYTYAASGSPVGTSSPIPEPEHNLGLSIRLLNHMERFVMAHELAHIRERHADRPQSPALEYEADSLAVSLVATLADIHHGSWAVGYWACELALVALNLLYRGIGLNTYGGDPLTWISLTHPEPLSRRENLRGIWLNPRSPKSGVEAAREMSGMMEAVFSRLFELALPVFLLNHQRGQRASPRWRKTAANWRAAGPAKQ